MFHALTHAGSTPRSVSARSSTRTITFRSAASPGPACRRRQRASICSARAIAFEAARASRAERATLNRSSCSSSGGASAHRQRAEVTKRQARSSTGRKASTSSGETADPEMGSRGHALSPGSDSPARRRECGPRTCGAMRRVEAGASARVRIGSERQVRSGRRWISPTAGRPPPSRPSRHSGVVARRNVIAGVPVPSPRRQ